jgi:hypothetical protein
MATATEQISVVADASKARALLAVLIPVAFPFIAAFALARSGHTLWDYPSLVASGQLSLVRQLGMWAGLVLVIAVYVPPALTALARRNYLCTTASQLITPSGERFNLAEIKKISVRKTFWHKVLTLQLRDEARRIIVTFARPLAPDIREALKADANLKNISVT